MRFGVELTEAALGHIRQIDAKDRLAVLDEIERRLSHEPVGETKNRKPLTKPTGLGEELWEIRFGRNNKYRAFYRTDLETRVVTVVAVGRKIRDRLFIGREEYDL